jgi:BirA family biotin operon repressor/biotin-[acetyl-CoA-carboxylase] ligase
VFGGEVFVTSHQKKGRGQRGNSWNTEPDKNITLSIILKPSFLQVRDQFKLNIAISLGIIHFLDHYLKAGLKIKWPNDIFLNNLKLGGILIENFLRNHIIESSIIGIGINVNQTFFNGLKATSLCKATGKTYQLEVFIETLLESIETKFIELQNGIFEKMKQQYIGNLYRYQEQHEFIDMKYNKGEKFIGEILGIEPSGKLAILNHHEKSMYYFDFKEIQFVNT